ncbi:MAG: hypothetical protein WBY94_10860 [Polyangiaceae bacterium]
MNRRAVLAPLATGLAGLISGVVELGLDPKHALFAYTAGFLAALSTAVGALLFLMIAQTAGAQWFVIFQRVTGAVAATMPIFVVLFVPIALGTKWLYPWAKPSAGLDEQSRAWAAHAHAWLNVPFFLARSFLYLFLWASLAILLRHESVLTDTRPEARSIARQRFVSAAGLPVMAITLTLAAFDWVMSMNPRWTSDILGVYSFAGAFSGAMGATALGAWLAWRARLLPRDVGPAHFHALGRVLLVAVIFWAYIGFAQFLLVWIADMARETSFYLDRSGGVWAYMAVVLFAAHFAIPFLLLLSRSLKRTPSMLGVVGGLLVCAHALDVYWLVVPALRGGVRWLDLPVVIGVVGVAGAFGVWRFFSAQPIPVRDPALTKSLRYESP